MLIGLQQRERSARRMLLNPAEDAGDLLGGDGAVDDAQLEQLLGEELGLFVGGHPKGADWVRLSGKSATQAEVSSFVAASLYAERSASESFLARTRSVVLTTRRAISPR